MSVVLISNLTDTSEHHLTQCKDIKYIEYNTLHRIDIRAVKDNKFQTVIVVEVLSFYLIHFGGT